MSESASADQVHVTLPDGSSRPVPAGTTGADIATDIGPGLARAALAVRLDGALADLLTPIEKDVALEIVTRDDAARDEVLELLRHDAAHVLAEAVQELYPGTQVTFGPAIEDGFFYDFARDEPFTPDDLEKIEARMREIVGRDEAIRREVWDRNDAIRFFKDKGEHYKAEHIESLPADAEISIYRQGDWLDLCTGPHLPSTGKLGSAFKLTKVSGAYWRGDARNQQLQRIYGTCWRNDKELAAYLHRLEEAAKRDHRRLGREMGLFHCLEEAAKRDHRRLGREMGLYHLQEEAAGSVFWHPKGWSVYRQCEQYIRSRLEDAGYQEIKTPQLYDRSLWERSGHAEKFTDEMFTLADEGNRALGLKPMNCPGHVQIFRQGLKSYRDLPLRLAEFGACMRNEPSGALHGIMRVRAFTQDDAHIFCTEDQIVAETKSFCALLSQVYRDFGFDDFFVKFSDRPETRAGSDATWDKAENALREATEAAGLEYQLNPGEGAFYGPKLEFVLRDAIGRDWQCGTLQVDFVLPERLDASYVGEDGEKHRPVMLHRAILGSFERFIGILVEHYAGHLPFWLAPTQVVVATITQDADDYAHKVVAACEQAGLRVEADLRNEKINYKVREHTLAKVPAMLVVGRREAEEGTVALRRAGGKKQEVMDLDAAVNGLKVDARSPAAAPAS